MSVAESALNVLAASVTKILAVTEIEAGDDRAWFFTHPGRRFRARRAATGLWLVRRTGDALLRTFAREVISVADRDKDIAALWFAAAYPDLFAQSMKRGRKVATGGR
jgi:hypothetical protein